MVFVQLVSGEASNANCGNSSYTYQAHAAGNSSVLKKVVMMVFRHLSVYRNERNFVVVVGFSVSKQSLAR